MTVRFRLILISIVLIQSLISPIKILKLLKVFYRQQKEIKRVMR